MQNMMSNQTTDPTTKHGMLSGVNLKLGLFTKQNRSRGPSPPHSMMLLLIGCMKILFLILAALLKNNTPTFSATRANQSILFCCPGQEIVHLSKFKFFASPF
jgi:hypothetical protein